MNLFDRKYIAEFVGTFLLVFVGCSVITIGGMGAALSTTPLALVGIGLAFGLSVTAAAYGIGSISGAHLNPAVTMAVWTAGRMETKDVIPYIVAQVIGAIVASAVLLVVLKGRAGGWDVGAQGLGQNGWDPVNGYGVGAAILVEFVATLLFTIVILGATGKGATPVAGLAIGLTLAILHVAFIKVSGNSVNPARSLGPALFVGGTALAQVWLYLVVPTVAGIASGLLVKSKIIDV